MPNYTFRNNINGEEYTISLTLAEREEYIGKNDVTQILSPTATNWRGKPVKVDNGFNSILKKIKKDYPRSTINTF